LRQQRATAGKTDHRFDITGSDFFAEAGRQRLSAGLRLTQGLPVLALNIDQVDVDFFRIKNAGLAAFLAWQNRPSVRYHG
jgi:hypothetical protein